MKKKRNPYIKCLKNYARFNGRAPRKEFWGYSLINAAIILTLLILHAVFETGILHNIMTYLVIAYVLGTILPTLAVISRRWHDIGRTGFWVLLNLIPGAGTLVTLCFFLRKGDEGKNYYGKDPLRKKHDRRDYY